jgi:general secretion pathway protein D
MAGVGPGDSVDPVRSANLTARFPPGYGFGTQPLGAPPGARLFTGVDSADRARVDLSADAPPGATDEPANGEPGVELNFENADIAAVAKAIVSDKLGLNVAVDPRVQGTITIASASPVPKKDLLAAFESVLRMSNAAIVREGAMVKIVPIAEAAGAGGVNLSASQAGFGVTVVPLRYASAAAVAKASESFLTRPGALRADPARNLLMVQGTEAERRDALQMIASFDVEWLKHQSVGIYPLKSTSPDTMIHELERVFDTADGGQGQGLINFQPIARLNAVMAVSRNQKFLDQATQWVRRLDREDTTGTTVRVYRLENGNATRIAKILSDIFVGRSGGAADTAANQIAPGTGQTQSRLDAINTGSAFSGANSNSTSASSSAGATTTASSGPMTGGATNGRTAASFDNFSDGKANSKSPDTELAAAFGALPKGIFQGVRITADTVNNSLVIYSNEDDYRVIERSIRELDKPRLQVAIDATIAEVTLTDALQYGVQYYLGSKTGLISLTDSSSSTATVPQVPGLNAMLGNGVTPKVILSALSSLTSVKVLSAPSLVVSDSQPAYLQVGNSIPISTGSATVLSAQNTVVNTTTYQDTGIILKVWPHVHANGEVQLEMDQEVSGVVGGIPPTGTTNLNPTLSERRVHSTVSVASGQTVLVGGLISDEDDRTQSGVPILRQIKIVGDLFGSTNGNKTRTEIIVFVRPRIVDGAIDSQEVAEEFRARLATMHAAAPVLYDAGPAPLRSVKAK